MTDVELELERLRAAGLERRLREISSPIGPRVVLDGRDVLLLCTNDYLGLAAHPDVRAAAVAAVERWGAGAGASRLVSGTLAIHRELEAELAAFKGYPSCLLFGSGTLANMGVIAALAAPGGAVLSDRLNHASIVDGCRLARAETIVYEHADLDSLARGLERCRGRPALIVTDTVFSMDGDLAPLAGIVELARRHRARVVVDEAHATGVVGPGGRGLVAELGLEDQVDVVVGTLGKALGSYGAYVCCDSRIAHYLVNRARTFIFSTALPPAAVAAAQAALRLVHGDPDRVARLRANARTLGAALAREGFDVRPGPIPIVPLIVGAPEDAVALSDAALQRGVFAQAIRPPTVPPGTARLRLTPTAAHHPADLVAAARTVAGAARDLAALPA